MTVSLWFGVPGTGKTQAMCDAVNLQAESQLFFVADRTNDWSLDDSNKRWRGKAPPGLTLGIEEFQEYTKKGIVESLEDYLAEIDTGVIVFQQWPEWEVAEYGKEIGNCCFVSDEIDTVATYKDWGINPLRDFVHRGRHIPNRLGVMGLAHIYGAARRPQSLHTDITSLADEVTVFRVNGHHTIKRLIADSIIEPEQESLVTELKDFHFYQWKSTGEKQQGFISNPFKGLPKR